MANSGAEEDEWGSDDEEEREQGDDNVVVEDPLGSRDSAKPMLCFPTAQSSKSSVRDYSGVNVQ